MGVTLPIAEFLAEAATRGVRFERTLTIGRQSSLVGPRALRAVLRNHGRGAASTRMRFNEGPWIEPFLAALGAREALAMDASGYEGASIVHDLNQRVPETLHGRFTVVFDGGCLEHIFNVPVAIANYMELVEVGGHLIIATPGNNYFGHGIYQFSPEFFFRVLSPENGFRIDRLVAMETDVAIQPVLRRVAIPFEFNKDWYEVNDPAAVGQRVMLTNARPVLLTVQARRTHRVPIQETPVYQSDYVSAWGTRRDESAHVVMPTKRRSRTRRNDVHLLWRRYLGRERRSVVALDILPRALPFLNPWWFGRESHARSFGNRVAYRPVPRGKRPRP